MNSFPCPECGELRPPFSKSCTACGSTAAPAKAPVVYPDYCKPKARISWREQWFLDRGLPYEPPVVGSEIRSFQGAGVVAAKRVPMREPGEDEDEGRGAV